MVFAVRTIHFFRLHLNGCFFLSSLSFDDAKNYSTRSKSIGSNGFIEDRSWSEKGIVDQTILIKSTVNGRECVLETILHSLNISSVLSSSTNTHRQMYKLLAPSNTNERKRANSKSATNKFSVSWKLCASLVNKSCSQWSRGDRREERERESSM